MNVKMIVEEWLKEHEFDGLCNLDIPCGCLCGDLIRCKIAAKLAELDAAGKGEG